MKNPLKAIFNALFPPQTSEEKLHSIMIYLHNACAMHANRNPRRPGASALFFHDTCSSTLMDKDAPAGIEALTDTMIRLHYYANERSKKEFTDYIRQEMAKNSPESWNIAFICQRLPQIESHLDIKTGNATLRYFRMF